MADDSERRTGNTGAEGFEEWCRRYGYFSEDPEAARDYEVYLGDAEQFEETVRREDAEDIASAEQALRDVRAGKARILTSEQVWKDLPD